MENIFSYNDDIAKNAYLNWRTDQFDHINNMLVVAKGFSDSALLLVEEILIDNTNKRADNMIFPILFNTNHSIEVYLKAICWSQNQLLGNNETFKGNHDLKELIEKVIILEKNLGGTGEKEKFDEMLYPLKEYIDELYAKIERTRVKKGKDQKVYNITFSRYSLNNDMEPQFYINTFDNIVVDLENYRKVFKEIFSNLSSLSIHYLNLLETE